MRILFCDLDGTLRQTKSGATFINSPDDQQPVPGALGTIEKFAANGYLIVGITNQGGCAAIDPATGKPRKSLEDAIAEQRITLDIFPQLEFILFCPTYDADSHSYLVKRGETAIKLPTPQSVSCRKPGHGMILQAVQLLGTADLVASLMIGDREEDSQCAQSAGVRFVWASEAVKSD